MVGATAYSPRSTSPISDSELLRHHADLLRKRGAASRARVHDDRRRRDRAPSPPARRGRVLPDRHRRARRARRRRRARARDQAAGARRPQRRALQGARAADRGLERLLHPHDRPAARRDGAGSARAGARERVRLRGARTRAGTARAARTSRQRTRSTRAIAARSITSSSRASGRTATSSSCPPFRSRCERLYAEQRGLRRAPHPLQRGALVHPLGPARRAADPPPADVGRAGAVGSRARLLRVVRRAAQLLLRALLRRSRRPT